MSFNFHSQELYYEPYLNITFHVISEADKERGISNPHAEIFADAYRQALDNGKHGGKIVVPYHLQSKVKNAKLRRHLSHS